MKKNIRKILIAKLRHHGDVLLTSPVFSVLKDRYPEAEIDAYLYAETLPMLEGHPAISDFLLYDKRWKKLSLFRRLIKEWALLRQIRKKGYDLVINLTEGDRGALAAYVSKASYVVGVDPEGGGMWRKASIYTHIIKHHPKPRHSVEKNLDALRVFKIFPGEDERDLVFSVPEVAEERVRQLLGGRDDYVLIHAVSRWLFKCLPPEKITQMIRYLHARGNQIVMTASPDSEELAMVDEILRRIPEIPVLNLGGKTSLKELGALIEGAKLLISVDSVSLHLSSALKTPVIALFGPTCEKTWGPWRNSQGHVICEDFTCRPCYRPGCAGSGKSDCLERLRVERIIVTIESVLQNRKSVPQGSSKFLEPSQNG